MRIIDAHIHFFPDSYFDSIARAAGHENSEAHLREVYAAHQIKHAVVMGNRSLAPETHRYPDFLSYCVGLDSSNPWYDDPPRTTQQVERHLQRKNCVGIKLYPGYNPYPVTDPIYHPFFELAMAYRKPVAVHTGATATSTALLKYSHPMLLDEAATAFPKVQFVMCHFGNPWIVDAAAVMSKNHNVCADLSGMLEGHPDMRNFFLHSAGYVAHLKTWLQYLGSYERLLYGTDWPLINIPSYIEFIAELIPARHHDLVFFENANRVYGLGL